MVKVQKYILKDEIPIPFVERREEMEKLITGKGFASCDEQLEVIDKLCSDYRRNLIRRFQESNSGGK